MAMESAGDGMDSTTMRVSSLCADYLRHVMEKNEHGSLDSALREVLTTGADSDWQDKARAYRESQAGEE